MEKMGILVGFYQWRRIGICISGSFLSLVGSRRISHRSRSLFLGYRIPALDVGLISLLVMFSANFCLLFVLI